TTSAGEGITAGGSTAHITALADPSGSFSRIKVGDSKSFYSGSIGGGVQSYDTSTLPESVLVDLNGDGLPDLVKADNEVEFNNAGTFVASTWTGYSDPSMNRTSSTSTSLS